MAEPYPDTPADSNAQVRIQQWEMALQKQEGVLKPE